MQDLEDLTQYLYEEYWHQEDIAQMEVHGTQSGEEKTQYLQVPPFTDVKEYLLFS